jgi:hypothetical protein
MWSTIFFAFALLAPAAAKLSCPNLSKFEITCGADGFDGTGLLGKQGKEPKKNKQGKSSLTTVFTSKNSCALLMERVYLDSKGKEQKYLVSCFFGDEYYDRRRRLDEDNDNGADNNDDGDNDNGDNDNGDNDSNGDDFAEGRLVCNNFDFKNDGSVHMEILVGDDDEETHIFGTFSSADGMEAWSNVCKLVK